MSLRLRCRSCQAAFITSKDQVGQAVECPKCGASQVVPQPKPISNSDVEDGPTLPRMKAPASVADSPSGSSVFIPKKGRAKPEPSRKGLWAALVLIPILLIGAVVAWPAIRRWLDPRPKGAVEGTAYDYLKALKEGDEATVARLGVVQDPPSIRSFREIRRDKSRNAQTKGTFKPIAALHRSIEKKFDYDEASGRFTPKDALGPAAATLDALHEAKAKAEKDDIYKKMAGGTPEEQMQAAIDYGGVFSKLANGILSPKKLIPSYKMLVQEAKPALSGAELALALDYAGHRESWDGLLKRPFPTLKSSGPFQFDKAEVTAEVKDKLASSGDPPATLRLKLVRFQMDGIDTGWKVVSARRITPGMPDLPEDEEGPEPEIYPESVKPSPGDVLVSPGLIPDGLPVDTPK